jgi:hypothetical protein
MKKRSVDANVEFDRRSYATFIIIYDSTLIMWESKKHHTVALSSTEAESEVIHNFVDKMPGGTASPA